MIGEKISEAIDVVSVEKRSGLMLIQVWTHPARSSDSRPTLLILTQEAAEKLTLALGEAVAS